MTKGRRAAVLILLAAALGLAALGQFYFLDRRDYLWDGVVFHGLAALCFVLAWRQAVVHGQKPRRAWFSRLQPRAWAHGRSVPAVFMCLGLFLSFAATLLSQGRKWNQATGDIVTLWLLGLSAVLAAVLWPASFSLPLADLRLRRPALTLTRKAWLEIATVLGLTILAFMLRITALEGIPYTLGGDEAWFGLTARQVLSGELQNPFVTAYVSMPTLFYWPISWAMRLVGDGVTGLRLPAALVGTATVPVLYFFARHLWGRRLAVLSALFLATYDYHIHYSRLGTNNIWDPFLVVLTLWLLELGLSTSDEVKRTRFFTLSGLVMGLSVYFYTGARFLPLLAALYLAFSWVTGRAAQGRREAATGLAWPLLMLILAFLVVAGPMLSYARSHPDDWNARINQVGIIQSGWLAREPGLTGRSTASILAEQFLRAAGAFHVFPDRTVWYGADRPLLGFLGGLFGVLGMAWTLFRWRERRYFLLLIWFWGVIISGGMLTESPPSSQRLLIAAPAVALLVAVGLDQTANLFRWLLGPKRARELHVALVGVVALLVVGNVHYYFVEFTPLRRYGSANGETATMLGHYLRELDREYAASSQVYFFGPPRLYWGFGTQAFLAPNVAGEDVVEPLNGPPNFVDSSRGAIFVFLPERVGELAWVRQAFPDGELREFYDSQGQLRFTAYTVP